MLELLDKMREIFREVQTKRNHPQYIAKMKKLFLKVEETEFVNAFINCLSVPLSHGEKHPKVENTFDFAAKFAASVYSTNNEADEEELCPLWSDLFDFLLSNHDVADTAIRFRMVFFLSMLLNSMGENAFIEDALCDRITKCMMERLLDKVPKIRAQAVFALHRLQDPNEEDCPVIKAFLFHLCKDPQAEVRRAVLLTIGKNKETLAVVLRRTRDINDGVRKLAYQFLSKITVRSLKIEQRDKLLSDGLRDRSEKVSKYVKNELLPIWLDHYDGDYIKLLRALDAEKALDTSILMLEILFKAAPLRNVIQQVPVVEDTKLIPFDKLSGESVIYWRSTVEHLHREGCQDEVEKLLPDLSKFCKYIGEFMKFIEEQKCEPWEKETLKFILLQLFQITKTYDLADEVGRHNLEQLIFDNLKSDNNSESLIDCIVQQLVAVIPSLEIRLNLLTDLISEMRLPLVTSQVVPLSEAEMQQREMKKARFTVELLQAKEDQYDAIREKDFLRADHLDKRIRILNEVINDLGRETVVEGLDEEIVMKNDVETLTKCLQIMVSLMQSVKTLDPLLTTLFEDIVLPNLDHAADAVIILALKATALCCLLDVNLAKKYILVFFVQFGVENNDVWLTSLKCMFDLLLRYGLEQLGMITSPETDNAEESQANKSRRNKTVRLFSNSENDDMTESPRPVANHSNKNIISILTGLLDNVNQDLRTIATEGLCKLLLHRRISSPPLLARLIILWHNPVTIDDAYLRQCLSFFFNNFPVIVPRSQEMLERCFLTTLKILAKSPATSPLHDIEPVKVARLIIHLSGFGVQNRPLAYCPHNNLAFAIIAEALNEDSDIDPGVLVRSLRYLEVNLEDDSTRKCLQEAVEKLLSSIEPSDKRALNAIIFFKRTLYNQNVDNDIEQDEEAEIEDEPMIEDEIEDPDINFGRD